MDAQPEADRSAQSADAHTNLRAAHLPRGNPFVYILRSPPGYVKAGTRSKRDLHEMLYAM